jgi:hypothetical protein
LRFLRSGNQEDLPDAALFREFLRLPGLREREGLLDGDLELASRNRLGELSQALRIRVREHGPDLDVPALGSGGLADDAPDRPAVADFGMSFSIVSPPTVSATASSGGRREISPSSSRATTCSAPRLCALAFCFARTPAITRTPSFRAT